MMMVMVINDYIRMSNFAATWRPLSWMLQRPRMMASANAVLAVLV